MRGLQRCSRYLQEYRRSIRDPVGFWSEAAKQIDWFAEPAQTLTDISGQRARWFMGGKLNTCWNAVDRHVERGLGSQAAVLWDSPLTDSKERISFFELRKRVSELASALADRSVEKGDAVIIYMPMIPDAIVSMLACQRLGAIHSVVFGGFSAKELAVRIQSCRPKVVLTASCGIEPTRVVEYKPMLDQAIELSAHKPEFCFVVQREQSPAKLLSGRDFEWHDAIERFGRGRQQECVAVDSEDPSYVLYTSGTTGVPKGVQRDTAGHAVSLQWAQRCFMGLEPGEVYWAASDLGWQVGHSFIVYGPLFNANTTILYEGKPVGTPDASAFWRVINEYNASALFCAPTAMRAIKKEDPQGQLIANARLKDSDGGGGLQSLRTLLLAGERSDEDTIAYAQQHLDHVNIIDNYWQTETGFPVAGQCQHRLFEQSEIKPGSVSFPVVGWDLKVMQHVHEDDGETGSEVLQEAMPGQMGSLYARLPLPPGALQTLYNDEERCQAAYFQQNPGYFGFGDAARIDEDGYLFIEARTDDIINVAGHRLSTGQLEGAITGHVDVAECAVVAVKDELKGELPVGFMVVNVDVDKEEEQLATEVVQLVRDQVGPIAAFKRCCVVAALPKTRSGKILRNTIRQIANGQQKGEYPIVSTIENEEVLDYIHLACDRVLLARKEDG